MLKLSELPPDLLSNIGSEPIDFAVRSKRENSMFSSVVSIVLGVIILSIQLFVMIKIIIKSSTKDITNIESFIAFFMLLFVATIGLLAIVNGIKMFFKMGGYYVGTPTRLIYYINGKIRSFDWEVMHSDFSVSGDDYSGSIIIYMKSGNMEKRRINNHNYSNYVPEKIQILYISDLSEVRNICQQRIKENTPPVINNVSV